MQNPNSSSSKLYVRGVDESIRKLIDFDGHESEYNSLLNFNKKNGLKTFIFASREFNREETDEILNNYRSITRTTMDLSTKISNMANDLEKDLKFESAVGFRNTLKIDAHDTVNQLKEMGIGLHMLSGDGYENCLMTAQSLELIQGEEKTNYYHFNFRNQDTAVPQLKRVLDKISDCMKAHSSSSESKPKLSPSRVINTVATPKPLCLLLDGKTVSAIVENEYLREHFKFIFEFTKTIVGYDLSPLNKQDIITMFKEIYRRTLAVGDGYNDILMLETANVGIQVKNPQIFFTFGDIQIESLLVIGKLLFNHGREWNCNLNMVIVSLYKYSIVLAVSTLAYQIVCEFSAATPFQDYWIISIQLTHVFSALAFIFFNKNYSKRLKEELLGFYCEKDYFTRFRSIKHLINIMVRFL